MRSSNFELLRIVAMTMIVVHHVIVHGIYPQLGGAGSSAILPVIDSLVIYGVNLFVMISGYFLIKLSWRSYINLMWIIAFYKLFHLCVDTFVLEIGHPWYEWILKPVSAPVSGGGWFVDIYVLLMLVSPLVNKFLLSVQKNEYFGGLFILLLLDIGYAHLLKMHFDAYGYSLLHFITLYFIGYGIRHYQNISRKTAGILLLGSIALTSILSILPLRLPIIMSGYNNPLVMVSSCCIFILFATIKMQPNRIVNGMAASVFPVYLIHDGGNVGKFFYATIGTWWKEDSLCIFALQVLLLIVSLFVMTIAIDQIRKYLAPYIVPPVAEQCEKLSGNVVKKWFT